jgi:hypothetical protein
MRKGLQGFFSVPMQDCRGLRINKKGVLKLLDELRIGETGGAIEEGGVGNQRGT